MTRAVAFALLLMVAAPREASAHFWGTHQYLVDRACELLASDGLPGTCGPLDEQGLRDTVRQGTVDADLRVAGIFAVDSHCRKPELEQCPPGDLTFNDLPEVVVGDHGLDPSTGKGFLASKGHERRVRADWAQSWVKPDDVRGRMLLGALPGGTAEGKLEALIGLMRTRNAVWLADFFWARALRAWESGSRVDAAYNLGIALHVVQDLSVPAHSRLTEGAEHGRFERYVWEEHLRRGERMEAVSGASEPLAAGDWVRKAAGESHRWDSRALPATAGKSVGLGVLSSAGVLRKFALETMLPADRRVAIDAAAPRVCADTFFYEGGLLGTWEARERLQVYRDEGRTDTVAFTMSPGERFTARRANVHAAETGLLLFLEQVVPVADTGKPAGRHLTARGLRKGDVAALVCTLGEGWGRVWIDGETIDLDVGAFKPGQVARVRELGRQELWVDVVRGNGRRGWLRLGREDLGNVAGADRFE